MLAPQNPLVFQPKPFPSLIAALAVAAGGAGGAFAEPQFQFDFNDLSIDVLHDQVDDSPNSIGAWIGKSSVPQVVAGNLAAPAGLNYALAPAGSAGHVLATRTDTAFRGQFHRVEGAAGVMWISALIQAADRSAAAVVIDGGSTNTAEGWTLQNKGGFGIRPDAAAGTTELFWSDNLVDLTSNQGVTLPVDSSDQTVLVIARIDFGADGDEVDLWLNPTLVDAATLGNAGDLEATTSYAGVDWVGMGAVNNGLVGYTVAFDNLVFSNAANEEAAFAAVTGLPEPPSDPTGPGIVTVDFDFDGMSPGSLNGQDDDSPDVLGSWTGTSQVPMVVEASLAAPASTNYGGGASGFPRRVSIARNDTVYRAQFHQIHPAEGVMWFSTLIRAGDGVAAAVVIDGNADNTDLAGMTGFGIEPDAGAGTTTLFWSDDLSSLAGAQSVVLPDDLSGQTALIVGRIDFSAALNEIDLWVNPALASREELPPGGDLEASTARDRIDWIGIGVVDNGIVGFGASFDNLRFSNDPDEDAAFAQVTRSLPPAVAGTADVNGNGISDLAEITYPGLSDLPPDGDADGDGSSNAEEALARTDPFDANSQLRALGFGVDPPSTFDFTSVPGVAYQIRASTDLVDWQPQGDVVTATDFSTSVEIVFTDVERLFVRAQVIDAPDSDGDGLEDALETYLGFATDRPDSVRAAANGGDFQQFVNLMSGGSTGGGRFGENLPGIPSQEQASRFLAQASFGPTLGKISSLRALGPGAYEKWIDAQLATNPNYLRSYIDLLVARMASDAAGSGSSANPIFPHYVTQQTSFAMFRENVNTAWMRHALFAPDELRQRMAWALSQIVVIGPRCNSYGIAAADWYDTVIRHSFGNYRDLLYDISVHPWMGWYLSHLGNRKADPSINRLPDENFAREIMQLFSIGLWELNMDGTPKLDAAGERIPTYDNSDIEQLARVFTGLDLQAGVGGQAAYAAAPMRMIESRHDTGDTVSTSVYGAPEKTFLGASLPAFADDPGRSGLDDVSDAVDILIDHPSCPPFIAKNLIQHFVTSNPSPAYVGRVATVFADDGNGVRGNLAATIKAILLDPEARDLSSALDPESGRLKGPMLRTVSVARAFDAGAATPALHDLSGIQFWSPRKATVFSDFLEYPFEYPSVFNFYEPGYSRPGEVRDRELLSPEFEIMNALTATTVPNRLWSFVQDGFHDGNPGVTPDFKLQLEPVQDLSEDAELLLDHINLLLCHGSLSPAGRAVMRDALEYWTPGTGEWRNRTELAIFLALISPDCAVLK